MVTSKKTTKAKPTFAKVAVSTKFKQTKSTGKKGLLSFLFSFNGNISGELFLGSTLLLFTIYLAINTIYTLITMQVETSVFVAYTYNIISAIIVLSMIAIGYKRAHALGISGFYSLAGTTLFRPFFAFTRKGEDKNDDSSYSCDLTKSKQIGTYFSSTSVKQIGYLILVGIMHLIPFAFQAQPEPETAKVVMGIVTLIISIFGFNILQVLLLDTNFLKRIYTPMVKIVSFIAYNAAIIFITISIYSIFAFMAIIQALQYMPQ